MRNRAMEIMPKTIAMMEDVSTCTNQEESLQVFLEQGQASVMELKAEAEKPMPGMPAHIKKAQEQITTSLLLIQGLFHIGAITRMPPARLKELANSYFKIAAGAIEAYVSIDKMINDLLEGMGDPE